jgi:uncharacterized repeat protein (TIGR01451 family)
MIFKFKIPNTGNTEVPNFNNGLNSRSMLKRLSTSLIALALAAFQITPAFATINNTVTATGKGPANVDVTGNAAATVGVVPAAPTMTVVKTITFVTDAAPANIADIGDQLLYTFTVKNTGNVTLNAVGVADANDGVGAAVVVGAPTSVTVTAGSVDTNLADNKWDKLAPGDVIKFTANYTVVAGDMASAGGGTANVPPTSARNVPEPDGYLDDKATASATYNNVGQGTTTNVTANDKKSVQLNIVPGISVTKVASKTTGAAVGETITYTYTVRNTGNTPVNNITLADTHNGVLNALTPGFVAFNAGNTSTHTGNTINSLSPGDFATYTATYVVTQNDVDTRQ